MDRRMFLGGMALPALAPAAAGVAASAPPPPSHIVCGPLNGLLALPAADRDLRAGLLLQPTIAAIDPYMRRTAAELATAGYTVLVWDPYRGETAPSGTPAQLARSRAIRDDDAMRELRLAVDHLAGDLKLRSVATIGWCLGGRFALVQAGLDDRIAAVVAYNPTIYADRPVALYGIPTSKADFPGQTLDEFALATRIACPVQVFRPGHDLAQPAEYTRLEKALTARRVATQITYFPQAEHGFSYKPENSVNRAAAKLAWPVTLAILDATRVPDHLANHAAMGDGPV